MRKISGAVFALTTAVAAVALAVPAQAGSRHDRDGWRDGHHRGHYGHRHHRRGGLAIGIGDGGVYIDPDRRHRHRHYDRRRHHHHHD